MAYCRDDRSGAPARTCARLTSRHMNSARPGLISNAIFDDVHLNDDPSDIVQLDDKILKISLIVDGVEFGRIEGVKYKMCLSFKH